MIPIFCYGPRFNDVSNDLGDSRAENGTALVERNPNINAVANTGAAMLDWILGMKNFGSQIR